MPDPAGQLSADPLSAKAGSIVTGADSSFYWAFRFLPRERRQAIFAVYAFCRTVDDIADKDGVVDAKLDALQAWRGEINRLFAGVPTHGVTRALLDPVARFDLHEQDFLAILDGMVMDAAGQMVAPSLLDLELYCRRAAGAVGMLSASIFGVRRPEGRSLALSLGQALQYVNFLRDLVEDAGQGRLYMPREVLDAAGVTVRTPQGFLADPRLPAAAAAMAQMAEDRFRAARRVLKAVPRAPARPARIMLETYRRLLDRLLARGFAPEMLARPVRLGRLERLALALRVVIRI